MGTRLEDYRTEEQVKRAMGVTVRRIRRGWGLRQEELAMGTGDGGSLTADDIAAIERGEYPVTLETLYVIAEALGCEPADLFD